MSIFQLESMTTFATVCSRSVVTFWMSWTFILLLGAFVYIWNKGYFWMWNSNAMEKESYWLMFTFADFPISTVTFLTNALYVQYSSMEIKSDRVIKKPNSNKNHYERTIFKQTSYLCNIFHLQNSQDCIYICKIQEGLYI